jgi:hypothetical protein
VCRLLYLLNIKEKSISSLVNKFISINFFIISGKICFQFEWAIFFSI